MRQILTLCLFLSLTASLFAQNAPLTIRQDDPPQSYPPTVSKGVLLGSIPALRDLKPFAAPPNHAPRKLAQKSNYFFSNKLNNPDPLPKDGDPLAKKNAGNRGGGPEIIPGLNFDGIRDGAVTPPDPTGDIGKNHYVQMTNSNGGSWLQVWDKLTGQSVLGPILSSTIWNEVNSGSIGDPIVQYDQDAQRWLILELQGFFTNELLIAISDNSDPTGGWKAYRFQTFGFGDYPKMYVWPNAYFLTVNEISNGNHCSGYALNRASILAGEPTFDLYRFEMPNYQAIAYQPATGADWEGGPAPPAGSPEYIFRVYDDGWDGGQDHLQIWKVDVDWANPAQSSLTGPDKLFPTPFETTVCWGQPLSFDCIEQPDPNAPRITALQDIIMYRAPYRNFGTYESVVFNHVSDVSGQVGPGGDAAVRWYELRKQGGGNWQIYQEGTYAPDLVTNRFMGTICTDEAGNIALGYSGVSQFLNPGLYITGRRPSDPLGDMPVEEYTLVAGGQSHQGDNRWGDYSNMSVDPENGRTFWFTGEYQPAGAPWGTRIGSFRLQIDTYDLKPYSLLSPVTSALLGNGEQVKVKFYNAGLARVPGFSASIYFEGNFVATESITDTIHSGEYLDHTFATTLDLPVVGKNYPVRIITHWQPDQFTRNDTLDVVLQKLTSNDVAAVGRYNLPGLVCGSETDFGIVIRNASGLPMHSANVHWRINAQPVNIYSWTGNLAAGERDTIDLHATGINNGLNNLRIFTSLPNGVQDERTSNDSLPPFKFIGNLDGTYLVAEAETDFGVLSWELRTLTNVLLSSGELSAGQTSSQICSDDNTCYKVILKSSSFSWQGHFRLYNIYGNVVLEAFDATQDPQEFNICTPIRKQIDVGPLALATPFSGANLTAAEPIKIRFRNFGLTDQSGLELAYRLNGGPWNTEVYPGVVGAGATVEHTFVSTEDLSLVGGTYNFELKTTVAGDQQPNNDTISVTVRNRPLRELEITNVRPIQACTDPSFALIGITVRNNGLGDHHLFDAQIVANGVPQPNVPNDVIIAPDASLEVNLAVLGLQIGQNTVEVDLTNVDGQGEDEMPANDTGSTSFNISPDGFPVQLFFSPNQNPAQNHWEVWDELNNVVASGGPYPEPFGFYAEELCLEKDKCYVFHLFDTAGDGMDGGIVDIFSPFGGSYWTYMGGNFGTEITAPFCTQELCAGFLVDAKVECPAPNNGTITAVPINGTPPFQYSINGVDFQPDPVFSNLSSGLYTLLCFDANSCSAQKLVDLCTVGTTEPNQLRGLKVSPNPTSGMANVELPALEGEQSLICEVFDQKGQLVQTARLVRWDNTLHTMVILDKQPAGTYFLRVKGLPRPLVAKVVKK